MSVPSVFPPTCANWVPGTSVCERQGGKACGNCRLVVYCSADCQKAHWPEHKKACRSPMGKQNWRPAWDLKGREPPWSTGAASTNVHNVFGGSKYFWGNTPALDVLNLEQNEGLAYRDDIALLFAASGDLRHVVKTIASLPNQMTQQISVTMNYREFGVVARNTILLLLALTAQDSTDSEDNSTPIDMAAALIHVWYSASFSSGIYFYLQNRVKSLISDVCGRAANKPPTDVLSEIWRFSGGRSLRLVLKKSEWLQLQRLLDIPD